MNEQPPVRVSDVMTTRYQKVDGMVTVAEAIETLKTNNAIALIVDKRHDNDEYGIVLIRDIAREVLAKDRAPGRVNVYEIMSKPVVSVDPEMDVKYCIKLFDNFGLSRAPVVTEGKIIGLVSYTDIVLKSIEMQNGDATVAMDSSTTGD